MAFGLKAAGVAALALTLWTLRWAIKRHVDSRSEDEQEQDIQQALLGRGEAQTETPVEAGISELSSRDELQHSTDAEPLQGTVDRLQRLTHPHHVRLSSSEQQADKMLPAAEEPPAPSSGGHLEADQPAEAADEEQNLQRTGSAEHPQQPAPGSSDEQSEPPEQPSHGEAKLQGDSFDQDMKQLSPKRTPRVQTQQSSSPSISVQRAQPPLTSPFAENEPVWSNLSPNSITPTNSLIKSSQSGSDWTPPQPPSPTEVPHSNSATQSILGAISLPAKYAYRPSSSDRSDAGSETIDGIPEDGDYEDDSDSDQDIPPTPSMAARAAAAHIFGSSPRAERLPSFPELDYEEEAEVSGPDQQQQQQQPSQEDLQQQDQAAARPALQPLARAGSNSSGVPRGPSYHQHLSARAPTAQAQRSVHLQPAPTEDPASRLDEAVRLVVRERNSMGLRSRSESDLSKRSSGDRASGQGSGALELDPEQEDSIRTDDLLERIQESGPSRHSSAASEPDSTELLRPGESAAAQSRRRKSADPSTLKRAREAAVQSQPLALRLDVLAGPGMEQAAFQSDVGATEVSIGRLESNTLAIVDTEVSSQHVIIQWDSISNHWQVVDMGSLNGSMLNDRIISTSNRREGRAVRLSSDDILQLGSRTKLKVTCLPHQLSQTGPSMLPKRLSTNRRSLHASPTLRSETVTRMAHQAAANPTQSFAIPALDLEAASVVRTGRRSRNKMQVCEDVVLCQRTLPGVACQAALFCVFDGHNGRAAADEAAQLLPKNLTQHLQGKDADLLEGRGLGSAWEQIFHDTDAAIRSDDGCTATAVLVWRAASGQLCVQVANVGDSSAVLAELSLEGELQQPGRYLTADHRLSNPEERDRLKGLGIMLGQGGTRLYGLNLGRCLGDRYLKVEDLGLSNVPHVSPVECFDPSRQQLVIVASDGVWDVASAERVVQAAVSAEAGDAESAAKAVAMHAQKQHTRDDVSVIALVFKQAMQRNDG